jgi:hypothetical protein
MLAVWTVSGYYYLWNGEATPAHEVSGHAYDNFKGGESEDNV